MNRSGGVTASAVLVFIGSGLTLLAALFTTLAFAFAPIPASQPRFLLGMMIGIGVIEAAFAIWGIVSGIGLLRLREWARISILIFSGILLFFTVPGMLFIPFISMSMTTPQAGLPAGFFVFMKVALTVCYAIPAAIGVWWLVFFSKRSVKDQFRGAAAAAAETTVSRGRPLSISIIGWLMVVFSVLALPSPLLGLPVVFMGVLVAGWQAGLVVLALSAAQLVAGYGLLKLKPWGRTLSICWFSFMFLNGLVTFLLPHREARFEEVLAAVQARFGMPPVSEPVGMMHSFYWMGLVISSAVVLVELWFVVTRRQAFYQPASAPAPLT